MSVNLSPRQLAEAALPNDVARVLHDTGIVPGALWLEITESTLMRDAESALSALGALRALGLHLAVDDFGTGYSSLAYLQRLPVETLKIDRSFIAGVGRAAGQHRDRRRGRRASPTPSGCRRWPRASRRPSSSSSSGRWAASWARASSSGPPAPPRRSAPIRAAPSPAAPTRHPSTCRSPEL